MDVNQSRCLHCGKSIHYTEARLLPGGGGVCRECAAKCGYVPCEECQDYFIPTETNEHFCEVCLRRIFVEF